MTIRVNNINLSIDEEMSCIDKKVAKKLNIPLSDLGKIKILKESIDARKKNNIKFNYSVSLECKNEKKVVARVKSNDVKIDIPLKIEEFKFGDKELAHRPVVIGLGPAGLFAALTLARQGYNPIVFERGEDVDTRSETVEKFWKTGILNTESNVQFGEGGAGAFSDGKLTTRIKDSRCNIVLEALVKHGADESITYVGKPHVGTDVLKGIVKNIREEIKSLGGEVYFNSKFQGIIKRNNKLKGIIVNGEEIPCEVCILALGHSSRDTYEMLFEEEIFMSQKPFAIGVRIEHPQSLININQYGDYANHKRLKAADYRLTYQSEKMQRAVYSFCMCPGGVVVNASSEEGRLCVNGMSYNARDRENANSALVVTVSGKDFKSNKPLGGMEFQRHYESLAYKLGGGNFKTPIQLLGDFLNDKKTTKLRKINPSILAKEYTFSNIQEALPNYVVNSLKEGVGNFNKKIDGFSDYDAILTGIETRTSAPVRIERNQNLESISLHGLYPAGEGAGFAGGIVSAAVDGIKVAESVIGTFKKN